MIMKITESDTHVVGNYCCALNEGGRNLTTLKGQSLNYSHSGTLNSERRATQRHPTSTAIDLPATHKQTTLAVGHKRKPTIR